MSNTSKQSESQKIRKALEGVEQQQQDTRTRQHFAEQELAEAAEAAALGDNKQAAGIAEARRQELASSAARLRELSIVAEGLRVKLQRAQEQEEQSKRQSSEQLLAMLSAACVTAAESVEHALAALAEAVEGYRASTAQRDSLASSLGLRMQDPEVRLSGAFGAFCGSLQLQPAPVSLARIYSAGLAVAEAQLAGRSGAEEQARKAKQAAELAEQAAKEERDVARWRSEVERTREALERTEAEARRLGLAPGKGAAELRAYLKTCEQRLAKAEQLNAEAAA